MEYSQEARDLLLGKPPEVKISSDSGATYLLGKPPPDTTNEERCRVKKILKAKAKRKQRAATRKAQKK